MRSTVAVLLLALCTAAPAWAWHANVKSVRDGDSLVVVNDDQAVVNVRLYGIDSPEMKQRFGYQAKKRLTKLAARQVVDIEAVDTDRYGRTVALVRNAEGVLVNETMVAEGLAWVYDEYCRREDLCQSLRGLQERARQERRGLWADDDPQRPGDWRREHKTEEWYMKPVRVMKTLVRTVKGALHP